MPASASRKSGGSTTCSRVPDAALSRGAVAAAAVVAVPAGLTEGAAAAAGMDAQRMVAMERLDLQVG